MSKASKELDRVICGKVGNLVLTVCKAKAHKAINYISPKEVIRATRRLERGKITAHGNVDITLTIGRPNYVERKFIKLCLQAGEKFPLQKVQLKYPPKRRK